MSERFRVRVTKDYLVFAAAHFISYEGDVYEPLHGHNYRVAIEVEGPLDEHHLVFNFIVLKRMARELVNSLDHRVLLPTRHPTIRVEHDERRVQVDTPDSHYELPRRDCVLLDVPNTTAERLAWWMAGQLRGQIERETKARPTSIRVEVEEAFGQWAHYEWSAD